MSSLSPPRAIRGESADQHATTFTLGPFAVARNESRRGRYITRPTSQEAPSPGPYEDGEGMLGMVLTATYPRRRRRGPGDDRCCTRSSFVAPRGTGLFDISVKSPHSTAATGRRPRVMSIRGILIRHLLPQPPRALPESGHHPQGPSPACAPPNGVSILGPGTRSSGSSAWLVLPPVHPSVQDQGCQTQRGDARPWRVCIS